MFKSKIPYNAVLSIIFDLQFINCRTFSFSLSLGWLRTMPDVRESAFSGELGAMFGTAWKTANQQNAQMISPIVLVGPAP
jgi:hypothetical protein